MPEHALVVVDMQDYFCKPDHAFLRFITAIAGPDDTAEYLQRLDNLVVPNISRLLDRARSRGCLVVFTEFGSRDDDSSDLPPWGLRQNEMARELVGGPIFLPLRDPSARTIAELAPLDGERVLERSTSGPLAGTDVAEFLRGQGVRDVVITGVATNVCVLGWTRELSDGGFCVSVPVDACASPVRRWHDATLEVAIPAFAALTDTSTLLETELL